MFQNRFGHRFHMPKGKVLTLYLNTSIILVWFWNVSRTVTPASFEIILKVNYFHCYFCMKLENWIFEPESYRYYNLLWLLQVQRYIWMSSWNYILCLFLVIMYTWCKKTQQIALMPVVKPKKAWPKLNVAGISRAQVTSCLERKLIKVLK